MNDLESGLAKQSFTGVWRLESYTDGANTSASEALPGTKASGILIYTKDGWMSAQLTIPNRGAPGSRADFGSGYLAYCGRYHLDPDHSEVIHVPEVASLPDLVNQPQRRRFAFITGGRLKLTAERVSNDGTALSADLVWRRFTPVSPGNGALSD